MKEATFKGISFGLTSSTITALGLLVGLSGFAESKGVLIGGLLTIALADSFSDALGVHISEESEENSNRNVWAATFGTLFSKLIFSASFIIPLLLFNVVTAIYVNIAWGLSLLVILSYIIAKSKKEKPLFVIGEHVTIAIVVVILSRFIGLWINSVF